MEHQKHVAIQVLTGSGNFPETGFRDYASQERLANVLKLAANHLKLQSTDGWVARLGDRELNPTLTIAANNIPNDSKILGGRRESGGGYAS